MKNKKQIIFIHGGNIIESKRDFYKYLKTTKVDPFKDKRRWGDFLATNLGKKYEIIKPLMPSKYEADYVAWKIWFERHFCFIKDKNPILIGHSLGATFLLKYLSENNFPKKISQLHLVAPAVIFKKPCNFEFKIKNLDKISKIAKEIYLWHSKDDKVCPFEDSELLNENISKVEFHILQKRGHFIEQSFPEILKVIKKSK